MFGRGVTIPGISEGNIATDEPCVDSNTSKEIISRHMNVRDAVRKVDNCNRIKMMIKSRIPDYVDRFYEKGDRVFVRDRHSDVWMGRYSVCYHENKSVVIRKDNQEVLFPTNRVIPELSDQAADTSPDSDDENMNDHNVQTHEDVDNANQHVCGLI